MYPLWKKGQAIQEDYKDVVRLCRGKIRKAKDQPEFSLATAIKGNKNVSKCISSQRRAQENLHPSLDVGGNTVTKDEEKAEVYTLVFEGSGDREWAASMPPGWL